MLHRRIVIERFRYWKGFLVVSVLILSCFPAFSYAKDDPRILLLLSNNETAYELAADSFRDSLIRSAGPALSFDIKKIYLPFEDGLTLPGLFQERFNLVITVGTGAAWTARFMADKTPVLNIMTTKDAFDAVWERRKDGVGKISAVYLEQPIERQLEFIQLVLPRRKNCGVLLGDRASRHLKDLSVAAAKTKLDLKTVAISATNKPIDAIRDITENNDVILVLPGTEALTPNVAKWLLYMAYQKEIPVIGFSKALVDAGALGAVHTTPEQIGRQAAEIVLRAAIGSVNKTDRAWGLPLPQYPRYFEVSLNDSVARSLKLNVQSDHYLTQSLLNLQQAESWRAQN
jgi:ABC-type uncharacterized transport system substrate-binding protein